MLLLPGRVAAQGDSRPVPPVESGFPAPGQEPQGARRDTLSKRESLPPLALPDIVVFGRATSMMRDGSKLFSADKRTALDREIGAPTGEKRSSRTGWGGGRLLAARERTVRPYRTRAYLNGGSFGEMVAGVDYWREQERWRFVADVGAARSGGHVANSSYLEAGGGITAVYALSGDAEARFRAGYAGGTQEEWGAPIPGAGIPGAAGAERTWFDGDYSASLESRLRAGLTIRGGVGGRHAGLTDDVRVPGVSLRPRSNGGWAEGGLEWLTGSTLVRLEGRVEGDRLSGPMPAQRMRLAGAEFVVQATVGGSSSITLGGVWYRMEGGLGTTSRVWPVAGLTSQYSERFSMFVRYRPRIDYLRLGEARRQNRFVANTYQVVPRQERFHLAVGLRYAVTSRMSLAFEVRRRLFDRLPLWRRAPLTESESDGLFVLDGLASISVNETSLSLEGRPLRGMSLELALLYREATGGGVSELPHLAPFSLSAAMEIQGPGRFETGVRVRHLAERFGEPAGDAARSLPAATDLGVRFAYPFKGSVTAWLELRNLLGAQTALWEGYPVPGRATALGFSVRF